jgi:hypothetical protein
MTVVAAPSMATIGWIASASDNPGLLFEDIWEPNVLNMFPSNLFDCSTPHCPLLAASYGALQGKYPVTIGRFFEHS